VQLLSELQTSFQFHHVPRKNETKPCEIYHDRIEYEESKVLNCCEPDISSHTMTYAE
jgi:hypothetical protein